jgi:hypothetical protein
MPTIRHHPLSVRLLLMLAWPATGAAADLSPYVGTALPETALADLRGGILLPNGLDVALGFDLRTLVDGQLALHTVLSTEGPAPNRLRVLVGDAGETMPVGVPVDHLQPVQPELVLDRRGGTTLYVSTAGKPVAPVVNILNAPREVWPAYSGETEIQPTVDGAPVPTALGLVTRTEQEFGSVVTLSGDSLLVQHLIGQATGVAVVNAANDRRIDTISTVDVDLKGAWVPVANGLFGVNAIVADAATLHR